MNIKNEDTQQLVRELAELTGETQTAAITEAVRERLERVRKKKNERVKRILAIGRECAKLFKEPYRSMDHAELLYDGGGLPRRSSQYAFTAHVFGNGTHRV